MNKTENATQSPLGYSPYPGYGYDPSIIMQEERIDFKRYLSLFLSNWYWFVIALFTSLGIAYGINRWAENIYTVSSTLLIEDENYSSDLSGAERIIPGGEMFKSQQNLKNEVGILKSFSLNYEAMLQLPEFWVSYTGVGRRGVAESRQYKNTPFKIVFDSLENQLKGQRIDIKILSDNNYRINIGESIDQQMSFGEQFISNSYDFRVIKQNGFEYDKDRSNKFYIWFNSLEGLANMYRGKLSVSPIEDEASILTLTTSGFSALKEADYLNKLMQVYIARGLNLKNEAADNTIKFINEQLGFISDSLSKAENNLESFRLSNALIDMSSEASFLKDRIERYENEKFGIEFEKQYYEYLLDYIASRDESGEIVSPSLLGVADPTLSRLIGNLAELQLQKKNVLFSLKNDLPAVEFIDSQIADAKISLKSNVQNSLDNSARILEDVNHRIRDVEMEIKKLPGTERQLINIQRKFDLNSNVYNYLMEKRAETGIAKASNVADNMVIDEAKAFNSRRIEPKERQNYMMALILGLIVPLGLLIVFDLLNNKIIDRRDIEKATDIPLIGFIAHSSSKSEIPVVDNPGSTFAESFRSIRARLKYFINEDNSMIISITSTVSGEGKTFISVNLATIFAMLGKKVLLVGLDLRKPKLHTIFKTNNNLGLSSYLIGNIEYEDIVLETDIENLFFTPSGPVPPNPAELIEKDNMALFFERSREKFDYIIVDTPPVAFVTDTLLLANYIDVNLFVIRQRYSSKATLDLINELKDRNEIKNLAILMNDINISGYYGYGLRYGSAMGYRGYYYGYSLYGQYGYRKYGYRDIEEGYYSNNIDV